jgi:hypothetical protein
MLVMPEPLMVGVTGNTIHTLVSFFAFVIWQTFLRWEWGSRFSHKGPSWKTQVVQWVSIFTPKDLNGKRRFAQWAVIFFWRGLLWKLEVVQLTSAFTRRTFLENEVVRGASFFTEGIFTENSRATKGSLLSQKDLSLLNFRPLLLVGLGRISKSGRVCW